MNHIYDVIFCSNEHVLCDRTILYIALSSILDYFKIIEIDFNDAK